MNLYLPNNIYSRLFAESLADKKELNISYLPSALISSKLAEDKIGVALIPTLDLLKNKNLYVSSKLGLSFERGLSNSYFYFDQTDNISNLTLLGDVSSTEVILSKVIFKEEYGLDVNIEISQNRNIANKNKLVVGDSNFISGDVNHGLSMSDKISDIFDFPLPFVNYAFVSLDKEKIKFVDNKAEEIQNKILNTKENSELFNSFNETSKNFIIQNISSLILNLDEMDREGLVEILKVPYYHGLIKDMIDVKFK